MEAIKAVFVGALMMFFLLISIVLSAIPYAVAIIIAVLMLRGCA
jgi:hypothetical protein